MSIEKVALLGLDRISTSLALGLKAQPQPPTIVGFDPDRSRANRARSLGALDRVTRSPEKACREADLVIVALPLDDLREVFAAIAPHLPPDCLVTDLASLQSPTWEWARASLPPTVSFIGGHIILNPATAGADAPPDDISTAHADLLQSALYCLFPTPGTPERVIDIFSRLASALGAVPFFMDITEHDGIQAGVSALPDLLIVALLRATVSGPSAVDMRRFAGEPLLSMTDLAAETLHDRLTALFLNRERVILQLEHLVRVLRRMRDLLAVEDRDALEEMFLSALAGRARWLEEREHGLWMQERRVDLSSVPSSGRQLRQLFFTEPPDYKSR